MIKLPDPAKVGPALWELRTLLGISRRQAARAIAKAQGRSETSVNAQLWTWDKAVRTPDLASLGPYLKVLGVSLALEFDEEEEP